MKTRSQAAAFLLRFDWHRYRHQKAGMTVADFKRIENHYRALVRKSNNRRKTKRYQKRREYWLAIRFIAEFYERAERHG